MSEENLAASLEEAIELMQEECTRLRNQNRILRVVNSGLRSKLTVAQNNDEEFKSMCAMEIESVDVI